MAVLRPGAVAGESRGLLSQVSWPLSPATAEARGDRSAPRLTDVNGSLELTSPSFRHEALARRVGAFVLMLARGPGRACLDAGPTRRERAGVGQGREASA